MPQHLSPQIDPPASKTALIERIRSPDFQIFDQKHLFNAHCKEAGLPTVHVLAQFIDGQPDRKIEQLPATDLLGGWS
jgi:hypothetical protein